MSINIFTYKCECCGEEIMSKCLLTQEDYDDWYSEIESFKDNHDCEAKVKETDENTDDDYFEMEMTKELEKECQEDDTDEKSPYEIEDEKIELKNYLAKQGIFFD